MMEIEQIQETLSKNGYEYEKYLGKGSFSSVILCKSSKYNQYFAIKRVIKSQTTHLEFNTMVSLVHPHIIKLYDCFEDEFAQYLVMEYCSNGTLLQKGKLSDEKFIYYARQILDAIAYCHSKNVAHRDIKPENIFVDQYDQVKLADFGMAKQFDFDSKSNERCGSLMFISPEMLQRKSICPFKADIWALGITFFYMATGNYPFQSNSKDELKKMIWFGQLDFDDYDIDPRIRYVISKMAVKNTNLRLTAEELMANPLFARTKKLRLNCRKSKESQNTENPSNNGNNNIPKQALFININSFRIIEGTPKSQRFIRHSTF